MNIEILKLHPDATIPTYGSDGAACFDLASIEPGIIPARGRKIVRTGLAFAVPPGYALDVRSRSGLAFHYGIEAFSGTLNADCRSELMVLLRNRGSEDFTFSPGERIAQARIVDSRRVTFTAVEQLALTERGAQGFGSSGR